MTSLWLWYWKWFAKSLNDHQHFHGLVCNQWLYRVHCTEYAVQCAMCNFNSWYSWLCTYISLLPFFFAYNLHIYIEFTFNPFPSSVRGLCSRLSYFSTFQGQISKLQFFSFPVWEGDANVRVCYEPLENKVRKYGLLRFFLLNYQIQDKPQSLYKEGGREGYNLFVDCISVYR